MAKAATMTVETAARRPVIAGRRSAKGRIAMHIAAPASRLALRAPTESVSALSKALGVALPVKPKTSAAKGDVHALWIGPDEWFLIAPEGTDLAGLCAKAKVFHSAVDVSHRNAALIVEGAGAADAINAGCPQDLSLATFPAGACSRTLMGKTEIILYRTAVDAFRVEVWRSFAPYAADFLEDVIRRDC